MKSAKKICVLVLEDDEMVRLIVKDFCIYIFNDSEPIV